MLVVGAGGFTFYRCEGEAPTLTAPAEILLGRAGAEVELAVSDERSGPRSVRVVLQHARGERELLQREFEGAWLEGGVGSAPEPITLALDAEALELHDGDAFLRVEARDWSWRDTFSGNLTEVAVPVTVDLKAPRIEIENGLTYVRRGGSGAVVYSLSEETTRDGVLVADAFFPGHAFPSENPGRRRIALFAIPRDAPLEAPIRVIAEDGVGNLSRAGWATRLQERSFEEVDIRLPHSFLAAKIPVLAEAVGVEAESSLAAFQDINTRIRALNESQIREIVKSAGDERRWAGAFQQLRNSKVTSRFAEHRTYLVNGEQVSEAIHYGYDLAATARAPITAANAGRVIHAEDLGIYGNTVFIDHGLGLVSLYAHLSRVDVDVNDVVEKGQVLGLSGATGLAGGDHLHFAILVGETYVDPVEWWDPKWVRDHVEERLASAP